MSTSRAEKMRAWRKANPQKARAAYRRHRQSKLARGVKSPSDQPAAMKARVYANRAMKQFGRGSSSIAKHLRQAAQTKGTLWILELQEFHRLQRQARKAQQEGKP
jgi:hypothetical protein